MAKERKPGSAATLKSVVVDTTTKTFLSIIRPRPGRVICTKCGDSYPAEAIHNGLCLTCTREAGDALLAWGDR